MKIIQIINFIRLHVRGLRRFYIGNFTFLVGVAAAAVLAAGELLENVVVLLGRNADGCVRDDEADAAALAPQDDSLRLAAVRRLLVENRLAEARTMFAPIAFQPHTAEKWRTATGKTMEAISGGDGKSALTALDAVDKLVSEEEDED